MNTDSMDQLTAAVIDCFILNNGFALPTEGGWQTLQLIPQTSLYSIDMPDFLEADGLYKLWQILKERELRHNS